MSEIFSYTADFDKATNDKWVALAQQRQELPQKMFAEAVDALIAFDMAFAEAIKDSFRYLECPVMTGSSHEQVIANIRQYFLM